MEEDERGIHDGALESGRNASVAAESLDEDGDLVLPRRRSNSPISPSSSYGINFELWASNAWKN